jgi:serine/threonine-protein kinase
MCADRNLVFGLLALQMDFITREQLLEAMHAWMLDKHTPLGEVLCRRGALAEDERQVLELALEKHIRRHGDAQASLAALRAEPGVRQDLDRLGDPDVQASAASLSLATPTQPDKTVDCVERTSRTAPTGVGGYVSVRYRRLRKHAEGGLGQVFVALDEELNREVALKEIRDRYADHPDARARFLREAEVTGRLEHPGVVPVYGLGAYEDGRPFYAMRFIRGENMEEAITRFHQADEDPHRDPGERSLALRELLGRFVAVCNALAYAHACGVLHRDIKNQNIMLGEYGETLVVDWGLAKVLNQPEGEATLAERPVQAGSGSETALGQVVGTPAFMPPEQAEGRLDQMGPRSDVFALGATLYSLLTGEAPYGGPDILAQARRAEVVPARQRKRSVPAALEAVCAKAMEKNPEDRYQTARALAEDVQRWLGNEPVSAYREPLLERARRWGRRNRSLVAAGVVLLVATVVGLGLGLWAVAQEKARTDQALERALEAEEEARTNLAQAEANLKRALAAETKANANLKQAEANLKLAKDAVDQCFNVAKEHPLFQQPRMEKARKLLLQQTLPFYQNFRSQRPGDRGLQREEAGQWFRVGYIELVLGRLAQARTAYEKARDLYDQLVLAHPDVPEYRGGQASTLYNLGFLLRDLGERTEGLKELQQARDIQARLVNDHPREPWYQNELARTHNTLGTVLRDLRKRQEALEEYQQARALGSKLVKDHPNVLQYQNDLARTHNNLGVLLRDLGKHEEALKEYRQARDVQARLVKARPDVPLYQQDLSRTHNNLGILLHSLGEPQEAVKELQLARDLQARLVKDHPELPGCQNELARTLHNLGMLLAAVGKPEEALKEYRQACDLKGKLVAAHPEAPEYQADLAGTHLVLGLLLRDRGQPEEALKEYERARDLQRSLVKAHPDVPSYLEGLARNCLNCGALLAQMNRLAGSLEDLNEGMRCIEEWRRLDPRNPQVSVGLLFGLPVRAAVLTRLGRQREADADWDRVLTLAPPEQRPNFRLRRADSRARAGDYRRAAEEANELLRTSPPGPVLYDLACVQALNAASARRDATRPLPERDKRAEGYARQAVSLLRRAASAGYFRDPARVAGMDKDSDLNTLRDRVDYKRFRAGLK